MGLPPAERDPELSTIIFEDTLAAITGHRSSGRSANDAGLAARAVALRESLQHKENPPMTPAERDLLAEWLNRLADHTAASPQN